MCHPEGDGLSVQPLQVQVSSQATSSDTEPIQMQNYWGKKLEKIKRE